MEPLLYESSKFNHVEKAIDLLRTHPDIDVNWRHPSFEGNPTTLQVVCEKGHTQILNLLLLHPKLDVNLPDDSGRTPLFFACAFNQVQVVKMLVLDARVDINLADKNQKTPLWAASYNGYVDIIKWLVASGRPLDLSRQGISLGDRLPYTPLEISQRQQMTAASELLKRVLGNYGEMVKAIRDGFFLFSTEDFRVTTPPTLRWGAYRDFLEGHEMTEDSFLSEFFERPLSFYSTSVPQEFTNLEELTSLSLLHSELPTIPQAIELALGMNLTDLDLRMNGLTSLPHYFNTVTTLVSLKLSHNPFDASAVGIFQAIIVRNPALRVFKIRQVGLKPAGVLELLQVHLARVLEHNFALKDLDIDDMFTESVDGLQFIPTLHLRAGSRSIVQFLTSLESTEKLVDLSTKSEITLNSCNLRKIPDFVLHSEEMTTLSLASNPLPPEAGKVIGELLKSNRKLKNLSLLGVPLGSEGMLPILQAMVWNFSKQVFTLLDLKVDSIQMTDFEGLGLIPVDILSQGSQKIVQYIFDLYKSHEADPLFRTKLMVVGFESVGKSTILDCLFPLQGQLSMPAAFKRVSNYDFTLQGNLLTRTNRASGKTTEIILENRRWLVAPLESVSHGIRLTSLGRADDSMELICPDRVTQERWLSRLSRVCMNKATHGIEIQKHFIENEFTREYFKDKGGGRLELSVWDFAGQNDYYSNHQYFLSTRTVFLTLWRMDQGDKGLEGLEFWFRSLAIHLSTPLTSSSSKMFGVYHSILVVGTFLDTPSVDRNKKRERATQIDELARRCGLDSPLQIYEISCQAPFENLEIVREAIYLSCLSHTYMGERIPRDYLAISDYVAQARQHEKYQHIPILELAELSRHYSANNYDNQLIPRALNLLSLWGECVYFESPPELASIVILDPKFLASGILADLFSHNETAQGLRKDGVVHHSSLIQLWSKYRSGKQSADDFPPLAITFVSLLQKMGVLFVVESPKDEDEDEDEDEGEGEDAGAGGSQPQGKRRKGKEEDAGLDPETRRRREFMRQWSIIPALLPEKPLDGQRGLPAQFQLVWPIDPPFNRPIQIERVLKFNVVPAELVSRLLVHLHTHIQDGLVWKNDVVILVKSMESTQAYIKVEQEHLRFVVAIRGTALELCVKLLNYIVRQVKEVAGERMSISWKEMVRSPFYEGCELDLNGIVTDELNAPLDDRALVCPDTLFPLYPEHLLLNAGLLDHDHPNFFRDKRRGTVSSWWAPVSKGDRLLLKVLENGQVHSEELLGLLKTLVIAAKGDLRFVKRAYAVNNPTQIHAFQIYRGNLAERHSGSGSVFRKDHWRQLGDGQVNLRKKFLHQLAKKISSLRREVNNGLEPFVVPMVQGTNEISAFKIVSNGFAMAATTDDGYYGRGIYFTSDLGYAAKYAKEGVPESGVKVLLLNFVTPGNAYPVTEHPQRPRVSLMGQGCKAGYQSHYTVVDCKDKKTAFPTSEDFDTNTIRETADELVAFEGAQGLPLFLIYYDTSEDYTGVARQSELGCPLGVRGEVGLPEQLEKLLNTPVTEVNQPGVSDVMNANVRHRLEAEIASLRNEVLRLEKENKCLRGMIPGKQQF